MRLKYLRGNPVSLSNITPAYPRAASRCCAKLRNDSGALQLTNASPSKLSRRTTKCMGHAVQCTARSGTPSLAGSPLLSQQPCVRFSKLLTWPPLSLHPCDRSEEHTSALQSLMRISYAVFCLKKKKKQNDRPLNQK